MMITKTDFYKNRKAAYICATYIIDNDITAKKQAEIIKRFCPANVDLVRFTETVSGMVYKKICGALA